MNGLQKIYCRAFQMTFKIAGYVLPFRKPKIIDGEDPFVNLGKVAKDLGLDKLLVVTDQTLTKLGMTEKLTTALSLAGVEAWVYDKTIPNPTTANVEAALSIYKENGCMGIVALGGGSSIDCAKGVGVRIARPKTPLNKLKGTLKVLHRLPTLFAIPTTAGTGSETTVAAIITDEKTHDKYCINDLSLIPRYAVLNPSLTLGLPKHITSTTGMDALTHAVESYIGRSSTKETRDMSEKATQMIFANVKKVFDNGQDFAARKEMLIASYYAGVAFTKAYVGYVHAIAHTLGGKYSIPHGLANAVILPYVLEFYGESAHKKLAKLADKVGIVGQNDSEKANKFIAEIKEYNRYMDIPTTLSGIKEEDIPTLAKRAAKEAHPLYPVPKFMKEQDIENIYRRVGGITSPKA